MKRLYIFESHPVQYHAPVYRALHQKLAQVGGGEVHVFYATDTSLRGHYDPGFARTVAWDEPLLEGYPSTVLQNERGTPLRSFRSLTRTGVFARIFMGRPHAIMLTGLAYEFDWAAYLSACALRIPIWMRTETQDHAFERSAIKTWLRRFAYSLAYLPVKKALVIGELNAKHYARHGLSRRHHVEAPYCVVDRFAGLSPNERNSQRNELRSTLGISPRKTVLLFCGKLQPKKNPMLVLDALAGLRLRERSAYTMLFVGTGELEHALRVRAREFLGVQVIFAGFQNQTELAKWYLAADVLALPSRQMGETWGLVVNEALLAGCRVIVSQHAGCHADFASLPSVRVFDGSVEGFVYALRKLPAADSTAGQREFMRRYSVEAAAEGIAQAMQHGIRTQPQSSRKAQPIPSPPPDDTPSGLPAGADGPAIAQIQP
jgi:glycosyltransferase involved in cell wall biosynthesis